MNDTQTPTQPQPAQSPPASAPPRKLSPLRIYEDNPCGTSRFYLPLDEQREHIRELFGHVTLTPSEVEGLKALGVRFSEVAHPETSKREAQRAERERIAAEREQRKAEREIKRAERARAIAERKGARALERKAWALSLDTNAGSTGEGISAADSENKPA